MSDERADRPPRRQAPSAGLPETGGITLSEAQRGQLARVLEAIAADEHAPTAIRGPELAGELHIADSLVALELAQVRGRGHDRRPRQRLGLSGRRARGGAAAGVGQADREPAAKVQVSGAASAVSRPIENAEVVWTRAEEWSEGACANDLVVARALAAQPVVLEYAAPLLRVGGALVDWRGRRVDAEEEQAQRAAALLGMSRVEVRAVRPFPGARDRHLHVFVKERATPPRFPRRAGMARKRPLGR